MLPVFHPSSAPIRAITCIFKGDVRVCEPSNFITEIEIQELIFPIDIEHTKLEFSLLVFIVVAFHEHTKYQYYRRQNGREREKERKNGNDGTKLEWQCRRVYLHSHTVNVFSVKMVKIENTAIKTTISAQY